MRLVEDLEIVLGIKHFNYIYFFSSFFFFFFFLFGGWLAGKGSLCPRLCIVGVVLLIILLVVPDLG